MNNHNVTQITEKLITFPTISSNQAAIREALTFVISILVPSIQTKILTNAGTQLLWATTKDFSHPDLLLLCHIDVVNAKEVDFSPRISKRKIIGRGACDMKGSLAAMISVINTIKTTKNIQLLITSDEEIGGHNGAKWFFSQQKIVPKIAIIPDGISLHDIVVKQKGPMHLIIEVEGNSSHGSRPWEGDNPITKAFSLITEINQIKSATSNNNWLPTFTPTNFESSSSINQIPKLARFTLDLRITHRKHLSEIRKIIKKHHAKVVTTFGDGNIFNQQITPEIEGWTRIVERITHKPVRQTIMTGASDARHLPKNTQSIITRGIGGNVHGDNEWVNINSLNQLIACTKLFIKNI